jgi:colanic acid biosynthesis protein WcaH
MNSDFIPEEDYAKIIKLVPLFCIDFLIKCGSKYLFIKRAEQPLKDVYWVIGGRLRFKETIDQFARRVQTREIGRYFENRRLIAFSNYFFPDVPDAKATHTPSLLYLVEVDEMFIPEIDDTHLDYIWTENLPHELIEQTEFIERIS